MTSWNSNHVLGQPGGARWAEREFEGGQGRGQAHTGPGRASHRGGHTCAGRLRFDPERATFEGIGGQREALARQAAVHAGPVDRRAVRVQRAQAVHQLAPVVLAAPQRAEQHRAFLGQAALRVGRQHRVRADLHEDNRPAS